MTTADLQVDGVLDVIILGHQVCKTHCSGCKKGVPALHDEQLLGNYHLYQHRIHA